MVEFAPPGGITAAIDRIATIAEKTKPAHRERSKVAAYNRIPKMGFKILKKRHSAASGKHHHDDCDYSSSDEEDESYDSFEDENYVVKDDRQNNDNEDDEERSEYSSDDEIEIDPELLCPNCGTQTHEYVRKGTILKKWKRLPVEDDNVVDPTTGECISCKNERLEKMKSEWLDDIPTLPEGLFKKRNDRQKNVDDNDDEEEKEKDDQASGNAPVRTQGERYRNAISKRHSKKASSFGSTSTSTDNDNNEEQFSHYDESTFSCGISINSDGRSIHTGRSKLDTLEEVPEREETSVEERENSSEEDDDGSEDTEEVEEELDEVEDEIGDQLEQLEKEVSARRAGGTMKTTANRDETSRQTPSVATGRFDDFLADHEASPFTANAEEKSAAKCDESIVGQNGANDDNGEIDPSVAGVSNVLEQTPRPRIRSRPSSAWPRWDGPSAVWWLEALVQRRTKMKPVEMPKAKMTLAPMMVPTSLA